MSATKRLYFPEIYAELPVIECDHTDFTESMDGERTCNNCKQVANSCDDCEEYFALADLSPYKYEPGYKLCESCLDERMNDE